jgi:hypothetical protein
MATFSTLQLFSRTFSRKYRNILFNGPFQKSVKKKKKLFSRTFSRKYRNILFNGPFQKSVKTVRNCFVKVSIFVIFAKISIVFSRKTNTKIIVSSLHTLADQLVELLLLEEGMVVA